MATQSFIANTDEIALVVLGSLTHLTATSCIGVANAQRKQ